MNAKGPVKYKQENRDIDKGHCSLTCEVRHQIKVSLPTGIALPCAPGQRFLAAQE